MANVDITVYVRCQPSDTAWAEIRELLREGREEEAERRLIECVEVSTTPFVVGGEWHGPGIAIVGEQGPEIVINDISESTKERILKEMIKWNGGKMRQ